MSIETDLQHSTKIERLVRGRNTSVFVTIESVHLFHFDRIYEKKVNRNFPIENVLLDRCSNYQWLSAMLT